MGWRKAVAERTRDMERAGICSGESVVIGMAMGIWKEASSVGQLYAYAYAYVSGVGSQVIETRLL